LLQAFSRERGVGLIQANVHTPLALVWIMFSA